jgi:hypothetical protein
VREGLDRLLLVRFDETRGCSVVTDATTAMEGASLSSEVEFAAGAAPAPWGEG